MNKTEDAKLAMESLLEAVFRELLTIARAEGITVKRMREILPRVQLEMLRQAGLTQMEMVAESGYSRRSIRKILNEQISQDETNRLERFVSYWAADDDFPDRLPKSGEFPSFEDLCDVYAGEFTSAALLKILIERNIVRLQDSEVVLAGRMVKAVSQVEMIQAARSSITALLQTLEHNLCGVKPPFIERRIWSQHILHSDVGAVREEIAEINEEYSRKVLNVLAKYQVSPQSSSGDADCVPSVGIGVYWYERKS